MWKDSRDSIFFVGKKTTLRRRHDSGLEILSNVDHSKFSEAQNNIRTRNNYQPLPPWRSVQRFKGVSSLTESSAIGTIFPQKW